MYRRGDKGVIDDFMISTRHGISQHSSMARTIRMHSNVSFRHKRIVVTDNKYGLYQYIPSIIFLHIIICNCPNSIIRFLFPITQVRSNNKAIAHHPLLHQPHPFLTPSSHTLYHTLISPISSSTQLHKPYIMRPMQISSTESARDCRFSTAIRNTALVHLAISRAMTTPALRTIIHRTCVVLGAVLLWYTTTSLVLASGYFAFVAVAISRHVGLSYGFGASVAVGVCVAGV
jgi:hypothetical protein